MAIVTAVASGNYSNFAVTFGGIQPQPGDTVRTGAFTVNLDINAIGIIFEGSGIGSFRIRDTEIIGNGGSIILTDCDFIGLPLALNLLHNTGVVTFRDITSSTTGNELVSFSGSGTVNCRTCTGGNGGQNKDAIRVSGIGTLNAQNAIGGTGLLNYGINLVGNGIVNLTNAYEGAGNSAYGFNLASNGTANITNVYGGLRTGGSNNSSPVGHSSGSGTINIQNVIMGNVSSISGVVMGSTTGFIYIDSVYGNDYGPGGTSVQNFAVFGTNISQWSRVFVKKVYSGRYGAWPLGGAVFIQPSADNIVQFRQSPNGATKTLIDSSVNNAVPIQADVRFGTVYQNGDRTGTLRVPTAGQVVSGVLVDNTVGTAILTTSGVESAITNKIPDIVDGVHEADTRDYDDIPGSIGWEFKKLRQTNPLIEFEVTDDITPTDTEFAVSITETHDDGSFEDSVLYFSEGSLAYDNNAILSLEKQTGYSVITLQRPLRIAPTVGDKGIIDPLSHVHSIEAIQSGLALEATSGSILQAINEIDVDFGPILDRLPEELEDGRMKAVLSNTQVSGIQTTIINALKIYEVS